MNAIGLIGRKRIILIDILFILFIYLVPTLSHITSIPLYLADPMRISVLGSFLILRNRNNALLLAMTLPLVSFLMSGHPIAVKNLMIAIELVVNVWLIDKLVKTRIHTFYIVILSVGVSKVAYYLMKASAIYWGFLHSNLIDTNMLIQLSVAIVIAGLFSKYFERDNEIIR